MSAGVDGRLRGHRELSAMDPGPPLGAESQDHRSKLEQALAYAQAGWAVLPVQPRGKAPLTRNGVKDATTDRQTVLASWNRWPDANIGLAVPARFLVLDLDSEDALNRLKAEGRALVATVRARTARGCHFWYRTPEPIRNRIGLLPGIDVRTAGGYVVVPPSVHPSGAVYRWEVKLERSAVADAPSWLAKLLDESSRGPSRTSADWHEVVSGTVARGRRNQTLAEVAGLLFRRLPAGIAAELAFCWAQVRMSPPLSGREIQRTLDSIASRELRRRGGQS